LRLAQTRTEKPWGQFRVCVCLCGHSLTRSPTNPPFVLPRAGSILKRNINSPAGLCFVSPLATSHACSSNPSVRATAATGVCHPHLNPACQTRTRVDKREIKVMTFSKRNFFAQNSETRTKLFAAACRTDSLRTLRPGTTAAGCAVSLRSPVQRSFPCSFCH
jgi:hypothetical protein